MKKIYKYTHEQALKDGELILMSPAALKDNRIYASRDAHTKACLDGYYELITDVMLASMCKPRKERAALNKDFDVVFGHEIRDDDLVVPCATVVLTGES